MATLTGKTERELLRELRRVYGEYERLNRAIRLAAQRQRFSTKAEDVQLATAQEKVLLAEMNRLMDRMRAIEGHLLRARGKLKPLMH
jgi:hypothetical protein